MELERRVRAKGSPAVDGSDAYRAAVAEGLSAGDRRATRLFGADGDPLASPVRRARPWLGSRCSRHCLNAKLRGRVVMGVFVRVSFTAQ